MNTRKADAVSIQGLCSCQGPISSATFDVELRFTTLEMGPSVLEETLSGCSKSSRTLSNPKKQLQLGDVRANLISTQSFMRRL